MACLSGQSNDFSHKFALVCRRSSSMFGKKKKRKNINTKACPCDRIFRGAIFLPAFMHYSVELSSGGGNWVDRRCRINKWTAVRSKWNVVHRGDKWCGEWSRIFRVLPLLHFRDTADDKERKGGECFLASNHNFTRWFNVIWTVHRIFELTMKLETKKYRIG